MCNYYLIINRCSKPLLIMKKVVAVDLSHKEQDMIEDVLLYLERTLGVKTNTGVFRMLLILKYNEILPILKKEKDEFEKKLAKEMKDFANEANS